MPVGHETIHLVAGAALLVTGVPILFLAWRRRDRRRHDRAPLPIDERQRAIRGSLGVLVAACSVGAGVIHAGVAPEHAGAAAVFFGAIAAVQLVTAFLWVTRPSHRLGVAVMAANLGTVLIWAWSRSIGIPFLPDGLESVGRSDVIATSFELAIVLALVSWNTTRTAGLGSLRSIRVARIAAVLPVPTIGIALIATLLAFAPGSTGPTDAPDHHHHGAPDVGLHDPV